MDEGCYTQAGYPRPPYVLQFGVIGGPCLPGPSEGTASAAAESLDGCGRASSERQLQQQPEEWPPPKNEGSRGHPHTCKPCNKYDPTKPGSCKHGDLCSYCHCRHERPRHRGQRGRHAQQKREFLENRDEDPIVNELVDKIYGLRHFFEELRRNIVAMPTQQRDQKMREFMDAMCEIGEEANQKRPDIERFKGTRAARPEGDLTPTDVDKRCKWLIGTLHLMLRKKYTAARCHLQNDSTAAAGDVSDEAVTREIREAVESSVARCKELREKVLSPEAPKVHNAGLQYWKNEASKHTPFRWLVDTVALLASQMEERGTDRAMVVKKLENFKELCDKLKKFGKVDEETERQLLDSETLSIMASKVEAHIEKRMDNLFAAQSLEDLEFIQNQKTFIHNQKTRSFGGVPSAGSSGLDVE